MSVPNKTFSNIQLRRGTSATWTANNPVLLAGEAGVETDTGRIKVGNGVSAWNALPYVDTAGLDALDLEKADILHTHAAGDIVSGTLDISRIPTGTSGTTVAFGNHTHDASAIVSGTVSTSRLPASSTTQSGIVELATTAEAVAGTDTTKAVTPAGVASSVNKIQTLYGTFVGGAFNSGIGNSGSVWWGELTVSFGTTFAQVPAITVYCYTSGAVMVANVISASTTGFTFRAIRFQAALTTGFSYAWTATGRIP